MGFFAPFMQSARPIPATPQSSSVSMPREKLTCMYQRCKQEVGLGSPRLETTTAEGHLQQIKSQQPPAPNLQIPVLPRGSTGEKRVAARNWDQLFNRTAT